MFNFLKKEPPSVAVIFKKMEQMRDGHLSEENFADFFLRYPLFFQDLPACVMRDVFALGVVDYVPRQLLLGVQWHDLCVKDERNIPVWDYLVRHFYKASETKVNQYLPVNLLVSEQPYENSKKVLQCVFKKMEPKDLLAENFDRQSFIGLVVDQYIRHPWRSRIENENRILDCIPDRFWTQEVMEHLVEKFTLDVMKKVHPCFSFYKHQEHDFEKIIVNMLMAVAELEACDHPAQERKDFIKHVLNTADMQPMGMGDRWELTILIGGKIRIMEVTAGAEKIDLVVVQKPKVPVMKQSFTVAGFHALAVIQFFQHIDQQVKVMAPQEKAVVPHPGSSSAVVQALQAARRTRELA